MNLKEVYESSYNYLLNITNGIISEQQIDKFIRYSDSGNWNSIKEAYEILAVILQDYDRFPNLIKYKEREKEIRAILKDFEDLNYIASLNSEELCSKFKSKFNFSKETMWKRYCKGLISGAKFLLQFDTVEELKSTLDSFNANDMTREAFALLLSQKIDNMGFAIACNWVKELGYYEYPKPDTHTKDICRTLKLIDSKSKDIDAFEAIVKVAKEAQVPAYTVDKVWWLICSGNFYRYNIQLENQKQLKVKFLNALSQAFN